MVVVKFANNHQQTLSLSATATVRDALISLSFSFGLTDSEEFVKEWGLTTSHQELRWLNKSWLHNDELLVQSSTSPVTVLFGKRLFKKTDELQLLTIPPFLRDILYCQLLQVYLAGGLYCSAYKAVKLTALAAHAHVSTNEYLTSGTKWLQSYLPPRLTHIVSLPSLIDKNMKGIGARNLAIVQTAFIKGVMKLDTYGLSMYSVIIDLHQAIIGIGFKGLFWLDPTTFEPLSYWPANTVTQVTLGDDDVRISFAGNEREAHFESQFAEDISHCLSDILGLPITRPHSYTLETGGGDDESQNGIEVVNVQHNQAPPPLSPGSSHTTTTSDQLTLSADHMTGNGQQRQRKVSPFGRHENRRKAFRKRRDRQLLVREDSVEDLSQIMGVDFSSINPSWSVEGVSPVYDSVASSRVDATLRLSRLTSTALSNTLRWNRRAQRRKPSISDDPPPLPPKPSRYTTTLTVRVNSDPVEDEEIDTTPQRLGMYPIDGHQTPADGQRSRIVQPDDVLKDYATLRREFRMFCVKLPNGMIHWELASLYQPIHKLIARICILTHAESRLDQYQLFVEGCIFSQILENSIAGPEDPELQSPSPCNGLESMGPIVVSSKRHVNLPVLDKPIELDPKLTFKDHGITTSRLLCLRTKQNERLPRMVIKVPDWVKFHQCWLSIVHGNQPCSLQDAITLAAVLYQCYILDKIEANSVISSCNIVDFLPVKYACVKGIEHKILKEREKLLSYSRKELETIYIRGVTTCPLYQAVFFPCKEPKRQFLSGSKMSPILFGVNGQGVVRVDAKSCQLMDIWSYELFKNWGFSRKSFLLEFEGSTYPIKSNQGRWIASLIDFHVKAIMDLKSTQPRYTTNEQEQVQEEPTAVSRPYFILEDDEQPRPLATSQYFELEKVYEELLKVRNQMSAPPPAVTTTVDSANSTETLYVNPRPDCSLIHPDEQTSRHMLRLGLQPLRDREEEEEDEEHRYHTLADTESSSEWDSSEENLYDDILNVVSQLRSKRQIPIISEHVYYLPPDCYQPQDHL